jgi:hypothetical protein
MIEIVRHTQRNVKRWQDGDMRKRWTAAGMLLAEQQFGRIIAATATSPRSSSPSSATPSTLRRRTPAPERLPSPLPSDHQPRRSSPKFHDDPDILRYDQAEQAGCE